MTDLAAFAAEQFARRRATARRMVDDGRWVRAEAEAKLRPWLAIAAAAGADLPQLVSQTIEVWPSGGTLVTGRVLPHDICPPSEWREALAAARDAALGGLRLDSPDAEKHQARSLCELADTLGCRAWTPRALDILPGTGDSQRGQRPSGTAEGGGGGPTHTQPSRKAA